MLRLAIIPARIGSKRIFKKNIKLFCGFPIIKYSIDAAIKSNIFDEIMVSTDSEEIAKIANKYGAKTPFLRSKVNSDDNSTLGNVVTEVLNSYSLIDIYYEEVCCILPTAPLIKVENIVKGFKQLNNGNFNSVFPVFKLEYPIQRSLKIIGNHNEAVMIWPKYLNIRSQDLENAYIDAGQFYCLKSKAVNKDNAVFTTKSSVIILDETDVQDIDTIDDWNLAEKKFKLLNS